MISRTIKTASNGADKKTTVAIMVCECGERLVAAVGEETITTVEGESLVFRRTTDYVLCPRCHKLYSVSVLREEDGVSEFAALNRIELESLETFVLTSSEEDQLPNEDQLPLEDRFG